MRETSLDRSVKNSKPGRILALDYGRSRIGLALADAERELVREHDVKQIVVGLPLRLDGTRGDMAHEAARFGQRVHKQFGLPVEMVDERLTSWEAERLLEEQQGRK